MSRHGGLQGAQYQKKSFSVPMGGAGEEKIVNVMSDVDRERIALDDAERPLAEQTKSKKRHVLPFGDRILVRRRRIGDTIGSGILIATEETKDRETEIADVVFIPEHTFADKELIEKSEGIVNALVKSAENGDSDSLVSLLRYNEYLKIKMLKPGDVVMISKYVGTTFYTSDDSGALTMLDSSQVIGVVVEEE